MNGNDKKQKQKRQMKIKDEKPMREETNDEEKQYEEDLKELMRLRERNHQMKLAQQQIDNRVTQKNQLLRFAQLVLELQKDSLDQEIMKHILDQRLLYREIPFSNFLPFTIVTVRLVHDNHSEDSSNFQPDSDPSFVFQLINGSEVNFEADRSQADDQNSQSSHDHGGYERHQND